MTDVSKGGVPTFDPGSQHSKAGAAGGSSWLFAVRFRAEKGFCSATIDVQMLHISIHVETDWLTGIGKAFSCCCPLTREMTRWCCGKL